MCTQYVFRRKTHFIVQYFWAIILTGYDKKNLQKKRLKTKVINSIIEK